MSSARRRSLIVVKFGGAALSDPERVAQRVRAARREVRAVVVVASARENVTNLLEGILGAPRAKSAHRSALRSILRLHARPGEGTPDGGDGLRALVAEVERSYPHDRPLADRLLSEGERLAVRWLAAELSARDLPSEPVDADHLGLTTDNSYGASVILLERSQRPVRAGLYPLLDAGRVPVVTGYFGRSLEGRVATLGRGGSDYSASAIAAILGARAVELVKQGVAVQSADPRWVAGARVVPRLSYEEAEELAQFGARVLHPMTIDPARRAGVEIRVRSLEDPNAVTAIGPRAATRGHRALTLLGPLRLLRLRVPGGRQRPGVVAEISRRLARESINVVALYTSSALLALVVGPADARPALAALKPLTGSGPAAIDGPHAVELLTVIGDGVAADLTRIPSWVLAASGGLSATPRSLSLAVPESRSHAALRATHRALVEHRA